METVDSKTISNTIDYIIRFLIGDNNIYLCGLVKYVGIEDINNCQELIDGCIYIVDSGFFDDLEYGTRKTLPHLPLSEIDGIPILYGDSEYEIQGKSLIVFADIIASSYFLISRYEEMVRRDVRDEFGNFPAKESIGYRAGFIDRPIVDEYGEWLLARLRELGNDVNTNVSGFHSLSFTHDVDIPFKKFTLKTAIWETAHNVIKEGWITLYPFLNLIGIYQINPMDTFSDMIPYEQDIKKGFHGKAESICFIIATPKDHIYNSSYIDDKKTPALFKRLVSMGAVLGMHASYPAAEDETLVKSEKELLEEKAKCSITYNRNHYLRQLSPEDIEMYEKAGFTDDFTTGYNEMPSFRLGTTKVVKWINPKDCRVHDLNMHSLHIEDTSLSGRKPYQMELKFEEAFSLCKDIIDKIYKYNGDLCLLWHNGMFSRKRGNYQRRLYHDILNYISNMLA